MISSTSNFIPCASTRSALSQEISLKTEDASQPESSVGVTSKLTRRQTIRKFFRSENGNKVYICYLDSCSRHFNHLSSLIKHERIHRNERPYVCGTCGQSFIQSSNLKRHEKSHKGEKPYKCELCPKQFSTACNLRQHVQIHESCSGELKYSCSKCGKNYTYTSSLIKHQKKCSQSGIQSDCPKVLEAESEEDTIRKMVKAEEKPHELEKLNMVTTLEGSKTIGSTDSLETLLPSKDQILSNLSDAVRRKHSPLINDTFTSGLFPRYSTPQFPRYPSYNPSLNLLSQALHGAGSAARRIGFGFCDASALFPLQNRSPLSLINMELPSEPLIQAALERRLLQQNIEIRNSIRSCLLRNGQF